MTRDPTVAEVQARLDGRRRALRIAQASESIPNAGPVGRAEALRQMWGAAGLPPATLEGLAAAELGTDRERVPFPTVEPGRPIRDPPPADDRLRLFNAARQSLYHHRRPRVRRVSAWARLQVWRRRALEAVDMHRRRIGLEVDALTCEMLADSLALWLWDRWESGDWTRDVRHPDRDPELQRARGVRSGDVRRHGARKVARVAVRMARSGVPAARVAISLRRSASWVRYVVARDAPTHEWRRGRPPDPTSVGKAQRTRLFIDIAPAVAGSMAMSISPVAIATRGGDGSQLRLGWRGPPAGDRLRAPPRSRRLPPCNSP